MNLENLNWLYQPCSTIDQAAKQQAATRQSQLTKPAGSLGQLETIAIEFAGWQGREIPQLKQISVRIFAGDHGVCQQQVSAFPQAVTQQMISNFVTGGAAISVLSQALQADFSVINMGTVQAVPDQQHLLNIQVAPGTEDFSQGPAMSHDQLQQCLNAGRDIVCQHPSQLFIGGDMGIGNTSSAAAIYAALLDTHGSETAGPGTGLLPPGVDQKAAVIDRALALHRDHLDSPLEVLRRLGGLEIAGLTGAYIAAAQNSTPILVDGFITTAAALLACQINPGVRQWMLFAHESAEPAHKLALTKLAAEPLLNLGMRLGEGSGAALAVPIIQNALTIHKSMSTFADANVSEKKVSEKNT